MTLIKKKHLLKMGFTQVSENTFTFESFEVVLNKSDKETPLISLCSNRVKFEFFGAYTLKDLKDLLFFHYGEDRYNELFPSGEIKVKSITYTKHAMMNAFDAGFQYGQRNDQTLAADWFKEEYE